MTDILLVDDERTIRDSLSRLLREAGFAVRVAANGADNDSFVCDEPDLAKWAKEKDLMACGYWKYLWLDMTVAVESVDPSSGTVRATSNPNNDMSVASGKPYFFLNALCALDRPGEW